MRTLIVAAVLGAIGCGSPTEADRLQGTWVFNASATSGTAVAFSGDTYSLQRIEFTGTATADDQIEAGTFTADGRTLTTTPTKSSCPGPDPVTSATYSLSGTLLSVLDGATAIVFAKDTSTDATASLAIMFGCFDDTAGTFTPSAPAPVSN